VRIDRLLTFKDRPTIAIAVGSFADAAFPAPTLELCVPFRHPWVPRLTAPSNREFPTEVKK
jgi:hypothetical protein